MEYILQMSFDTQTVLRKLVDTQDHCADSGRQRREIEIRSTPKNIIFFFLFKLNEHQYLSFLRGEWGGFVMKLVAAKLIRQHVFLKPILFLI